MQTAAMFGRWWHGRRGETIRRLARDARGNTLAMIAAALVPLTAMIGSGVDMARAYTVQARLQQACDAAALAGRRAMTNNAIDSAVTSETTKFFNFNFPQGMYNTAAFTPTVTKPADGTVHITASTTMPTAVMQIFGYKTIPIGTACDASQNFINADVVLVLDTTGSMAEKLSSGQTKIQALRTAVMSLYNQLSSTQTTLQANGLRLRYAVVPYAQSVNVGRLLYAASTSNLNLTSANYVQLTAAGGDKNDPDIYWKYVSYQSKAHTDAWIKSSDYNGCIEERQTVATASATPTTTELASMYDLSPSAMPTSDATRWAPADPDANLVSSGLATCPTEAVRLKAFSQSDMQTYVNGLTPNGGTYLDVGMIWGSRFISSAGVFADSPTSYNGAKTNKYLVFLTDGEMAPAPYGYSAYGFEVAQRRVKGGSQGNPIYKIYSTSNAILPDLTARHNARFDAMCQIVRNMGVSVWTIKLSDDPMDSHLSGCAQSGQSATVSTQQALIDQFTQIGKDISELRLSQ